MDAADSLRTQFLVSAVFGLPLASLVLHLVLKPKFWTPSFIILAIAIPAFGVVEYLPAGEHRPIKPFVYAAASAVFFAVLFFFLSVLIGLIVRLFFRQEY